MIRIILFIKLLKAMVFQDKILKRSMILGVMAIFQSTPNQVVDPLKPAL